MLLNRTMDSTLLKVTDFLGGPHLRRIKTYQESSGAIFSEGLLRTSGINPQIEADDSCWTRCFTVRHVTRNVDLTVEEAGRPTEGTVPGWELHDWMRVLVP